MTATRYLNFAILAAIVVSLDTSCQKTETAPSVPAPAAFTIFNAVPSSLAVFSVIGTSSALNYFINSQIGYYGGFSEYTPPGGSDTVYVVQYEDTLDLNPKSGHFMFYNILNLRPGGVYSLFLTGADTSSPDYLFTTDSLPYHASTDSTVGIRFVNLSTGSGPMSINLEGSPNGSEVVNLPYKGITGFRNYTCNSTMTNSAYFFVIRDATTGDSLFTFSLNGVGSGNGIGLGDPNNGNAPLTFKNVTIAVYGSENTASNFPLAVTLIDNY